MLKRLQTEMNLTYIFISHDLSVVKFMSDMMAVMNEGKFVEFGPSESIYQNPQEAYTERLISAIPRDSLEQLKSDRRSEGRLKRVLCPFNQVTRTPKSNSKVIKN